MQSRAEGKYNILLRDRVSSPPPPEPERNPTPLLLTAIIICQPGPSGAAVPRHKTHQLPAVIRKGRRWEARLRARTGNLLFVDCGGKPLGVTLGGGFGSVGDTFFNV